MIKLKNKKKGFTLIELIIVIAIIAILAAIAIPKFGEVRTNANKKTDIANAKTIHSAVTTLLAEEKFTDNTTIAQFEVKAADPASETAPGTIVTNYLQSVPVGKLESSKGKSFFVTVDNGTVTVQIENTSKGTNGADVTTKVQIYPVAQSPYDN